MNHGGEAAEQIVRMSLNGTEVALKLAGAGAKNLAILLYAILKDQTRTSGKIRLESLIRSGKELKVFSVNEADLQTFSSEAKRYGILYAAIRNPKGSADGLVDVMVKAEDASRINRIIERFKLATVDTASIKSDIEQARAEKDGAQAAPEQEHPDKSTDDKLLDDLMGAPIQKEAQQNENPTTATTEKSPPSEPTSKSSETRERGTTDRAEKPSVRGELNQIRSARKEKEAAQKSEPAREDKAKSKTNRQPQNGPPASRPKSKTVKEK